MRAYRLSGWPRQPLKAGSSRSGRPGLTQVGPAADRALADNAGAGSAEAIAREYDELRDLRRRANAIALGDDE